MSRFTRAVIFSNTFASDPLICWTSRVSISWGNLYSLSGRMEEWRTFYSNIPRSLEAARFRFIFFKSLWHFTGTWAATLCDEMPVITQHYDHDNTQSRGFETSRNLAVRHLNAKLIKTLSCELLAEYLLRSPLIWLINLLIGTHPITFATHNLFLCWTVFRKHELY